MAVLNNTTSSRQSNPKTTRDLVLTRVLRSYKRKVLKIFPQARFDEEVTLGCTLAQWGDLLEAEFRPGQTWENYGEVWSVVNARSAKGLDLQDPKVFYDYFNAKSFLPAFNTELPTWLQHLKGVKEKPKGVKLFPDRDSPVDLPSNN